MVAAALGGAAIERSRDTPAAEQPRATANTVKPRVRRLRRLLVVVQSEPYLDAVAGSLGVDGAVAGLRRHRTVRGLSGWPRTSASVTSRRRRVRVLRQQPERLHAPRRRRARDRDDLVAAGIGRTSRARSRWRPAAARRSSSRRPRRRSTYPESWERIDVLYRELAAAHAPYAQYVDAGSDISPSGQFEPVQRCLPFELQLRSHRRGLRLRRPDDQRALRRRRALLRRRGDEGPGDLFRPTRRERLRYAIALVTAAKVEPRVPRHARRHRPPRRRLPNASVDR